MKGPVVRMSKHGLKNCCLAGGFSIAAFARGNYLLGQVAGIAYALVAFAIAIFVTSELSQRAEAKRHRTFCIAAMVLVSLALSFPAFISSDIQLSLEKQAIDRATRADLKSLFASDPEYSDLSLKTRHLKLVVVTVSGVVENSNIIEPLANRLKAVSVQHPMVMIEWELTCRDTGSTIHSFDFWRTRRLSKSSN